MKIQLPESIVIGTGEIEVLNAITDACEEKFYAAQEAEDVDGCDLQEQVSRFLGAANDAIRLTYRVHPVPASEPIPLPWKEVECDEAGIIDVIDWLIGQIPAFAEEGWRQRQFLMCARLAIFTAFAEARLQEGK